MYLGRLRFAATRIGADFKHSCLRGERSRQALHQCRRAFSSLGAGSPRPDDDLAVTSQRTGRGVDGTVSAPGRREGASSLAKLSERSGYLPKPEAYDERLKPGFRGWSKLFIFFLCNAVPLAALLHYLREQRQQRSEMSLLALPMTGGEVVAEALRVVRTCDVCFLLHAGDSATGSGARAHATNGGALRVDPHPPEGTAYVPPTEPLPLVPQLERNVITDLLESPPTPGLGFVHFALSRDSAPAVAALSGERQANLLYVSHTRGAYCTISGQVSVLEDPESRRRYWKNAWAWCFPNVTASAETKKGLPSAAPPAAPVKSQEPPPPWSSNEYILLRLAVCDVTLRALVDGPQRWDQRHIRRLEGGPAAEGASWELLAS
eukprot:TRINITY_DN30189_c0_g1_i1.p1 TRINITY_DN30189_c0_g1~~TRINITY_DN30189_c0_g1_i1.p1  ORF type:complete len:377 (-),score=65.07 TRINITY_DN30189_c0_g1_i1:117-1247(-)